MKTILLTTALCAVMATATAQYPFFSADSANDKAVSMNPENTISDNIQEFKQATIFFKLLNVCGLIQTFSDPGPLTVFLPVDSAFSRLSKGKLDKLLKPEGKYDLIALLTYHALPGNVSAKDISKEINHQNGLAVFRTISGAMLKAQFDEDRNIMLIDETGGKSILQKSDLKQQNGLIHLISSVLVPKVQSI